MYQICSIFIGMREQFQANNFHINNCNIIFFHMNTKDTRTRDIFLLTFFTTPFKAILKKKKSNLYM